MNPEIISLLDRDTTIVTPTRGLARSLASGYSRHQLGLGKQCWPSVDILDWNSWVRRTWDALTLDTDRCLIVLNNQQEQALWLQVIRASTVSGRLLQIPGTARQAGASYRLCKAWRIPVFPDDVFLNEDAFHFRRWVNEYEQLLSKNGWIDRSSLPDVLGSVLRDKPSSPAGGLAFYGFDQWLPQQRTLVETLKEVCADVIEVQQSAVNRYCTAQVATDGHEELERAARWARHCLEQDPRSRIGIVIPDLQRLRNRAGMIFNRVLSPENLFDPDRAAPFVISRGMPLANYPMVAAALHMLSALTQELDIDHVSVLLNSPFVRGYGEEQGPRARLDAGIRKTGERRHGLKQLHWLLHGPFSGFDCPRLRESLDVLLAFRESMPARLSPGKWAVQFSRVLADAGWPGDQALDSREYQTLDAWKEALDEMISLDLVSVPVDAGTALNRLTRIVSDTGFQPETGDVPVQVLGTEGTAAMGFDSLWITGLHDQDWPPPVQPDPFIPLGLQRQAGIPQASAAGQLEISATVLSRLVESATRVVLSYPGHDKDRELRPSPLLEQVTVSENTLDDAEWSEPFYETVIGTAPFEIFQEQYAPEMNRDRPASGGSLLFRDQALCPFRAFAHHRLHADAIDTVDIGLNALQRGTLVHRALHLVWDRLKNSKALKNTSDSVLEDYITRAVNDAIQQLAGIRADTFSERFRHLEQQRLVRMVHDWLQVDLERPAFTVTATEKGHHVLFAGITLNLRLDRIDQLADGRLVIIDYKTGNVNLRDWEGDRPAEPQLPLYAVTSEGEVAALVYASLKTGDMQYIGLAQEDVTMPGKVYPDTSWESRLEHWKRVLADLGGEFLAGLAAVAPGDDKACQYCDQHPFCRIHEKAQTLMVDDSDE